MKLFFDGVTTLLFILVLFVPPFNTFTSEKGAISLTEKRALHQLPDNFYGWNQAQRYFNEINLYLDDHVGFRDWFIYRYQREVTKRFDITDATLPVIVGENSWYFLTANDMLSDFYGRIPYQQEEINEWKSIYQSKKEWLAQHGIKYVLMIPPNKQTVYPEFLSKTWGDDKGVSRLEQIKAAFPKIAENELLLFDQLLKEHKKERRPLYYQSDTHWNHYGAYLAYLHLADKLEDIFPGKHFKRDLEISELQTRTCDKQTNSCGDLTNMMLDFPPFTESIYSPPRFQQHSVQVNIPVSLSRLPPNPAKPPLMYRRSGAKLKAIVFRDSFFTPIVPYFSENFSEIVYLWKTYDQNNVEEILTAFKPDVVIEEVIERDMFRLFAKPAGIGTQ